MLFAMFSIQTQAQKLSNKHLKKVAAAMNGTFSSGEQAKLDSAFYHVILRMKTIKKEKNNGYWLYVEQAIAGKEDKPYRQRVYHLYLLDDTTILSKVYELPNPSLFVGAWKSKEQLKKISLDSLIDRQGCGIYLHKTDANTFSGSTPGKACLSSLRGATYATSEVTIKEKEIISWDRGWDRNDKQMWGAVKGGYIFLKQ